MLARLGTFVKEKNLIDEGDRILCMVSGGPDSVAMLHLMSLLSRGGEDFSGEFGLGICHVNYHRRGEESLEDEDFVRSLGDRYDAPVHVIPAPDEERPNFQAWARDFRFLAAENLCRWQGYNKIAVAHNLDDRVETFLYRMITYSGRRSLVVMPPRRGKVIRPLLPFTAREIRGYLDGEGIAYRIDRSNLELEYVRNQVRHRVTPRLEEIRPDYRERITDTLSLLEDESLVLKEVTSAAWRDALLGEEEGRAVLSAAAVAAMPRAVARLVVRRWLAGCSEGVRLSRRLLEAVVDICREGSGTRRLSLAGGLQLARQYDRLMVTSGPAEEEVAGAEPQALPVPGLVTFGDYEVEAVEEPDWDMSSADPSLALVDAAALAAPLMVRPWRPGDSFRPLGLGGSKSLQDLFTDEKVPQPERGAVPIVTCGDDIVWVCGLRLAEDFRARPGCSKVGLRLKKKAKARREPVEERA
ncbi:MAG: tRNA lysidine(34) synthetase TilS [Gaiellales bacterium]|nr:MAG: tRNA lysidine(34) synthetase TilS [Gaiellales bacterium]